MASTSGRGGALLASSIPSRPQRSRQPPPCRHTSQYQLRFAWLQRARLAEKIFVHRDLAYIVQVSGGAHLADLGGVHAHRFRHARGVPAHTQAVTLHLDGFHVNGGGEGGQCVVPEGMNGSHQLQVF